MQVPDEIRKCICFVGFREDETQPIRLCGTSFYMSQDIDGDMHAAFAVTAKHVIQGIAPFSDTVWLRVNQVGGGLLWLKTELADWKCHPTDDSVDVAVHAHAPFAKVMDVLLYPIESSVTPERIEEHNIGIGDEVFFPGLFINHYGKESNIPVVRTGTIAAMPGEPIATQLGPIEAYLVEARSIGGLSGSPVFAYLGVVRHIEGEIKFAQQKHPTGGGIFFLLGLMHGHWEFDPTKIPATLAAGLPLEAVNMGLGIVVPVAKIAEVINQPELEDERREEMERKKKESMPTLDTAVEENGDVFTEEEFKDALRKVTRPLDEQSDQEQA